MTTASLQGAEKPVAESQPAPYYRPDESDRAARAKQWLDQACGIMPEVETMSAVPQRNNLLHFSTKEAEPKISWTPRDHIAPGNYPAFSHRAKIYYDKMFHRWTRAVAFLRH